MWSKPSASHLKMLRSVPLLAGLTDRELTWVDRLVTLVDVEAGDVLTTEGTTGREAFVLMSGTAVVTIAGREVATVGPGDVVGEMAVLDGQPRTATVTALEPMRVLAIDPRSFRTLLGEPGIARKVLAAEVARLRVADAMPAGVG
jgi:CRP/FNR family cyclic AMP-dependent transcriptional regulator